MTTRVERDTATAARRLVLGGDLGVSDAAALHTAAREALDAGDVVVDLAAVGTLDISATQILLALRRALAERTARLIVTGASPAVVQAWRQCGLTDTLG